MKFTRLKLHGFKSFCDQTELQRGLPSVLELPLITQLHRRRRHRAIVLAEQQVQVGHHRLREFCLKERPKSQLIALGAVSRPFNLDDQAHVHRVFAGVGQLELVFPFKGVVTPAARCLPLGLDIQLGEPERVHAIAEAQGRGADAGAIALFHRAHLDVDFPFAFHHVRGVHIVGGTGVQGGGEWQENGEGQQRRCPRPDGVVHGKNSGKVGRERERRNQAAQGPANTGAMAAVRWRLSEARTQRLPLTITSRARA